MDLFMKGLLVIVFAGLAVMLLVVGVRELVAQRRLLQDVHAVEVVMLESRVDASETADTDTRLLRDNSTVSYTPHVRFAYDVGGVAYESELLRPTVIARGYASQEAAQEEIRAFPAGACVTAFVNPSMPDKAFLIAEASVAPAVFVIAGLASLVAAAAAGRWA